MTYALVVSDNAKQQIERMSWVITPSDHSVRL